MPTETMKLSRASKRQLKLDKLCYDLRRSRLAMRPYRENMKKMVRLDAGADWSDNAVSLRRPYNGISLYKQAVRRALISQTPRAMLSTWRREHRRTVATAASWANRQFKKIRLGDALDRAFTNALFFKGTVKVGVTTPADAERKGYTTFAGEVFAESVHPDDEVLDLFATTYEDMGYRGHRYRATVEILNQQLGLRGDAKLEGQPSHQVDHDGDERVAVIGRGYEVGDDNTFREQCDVWEVWVPGHAAVLTFRGRANGVPAGGEDLLEAREYVGPDCGQYTDVGFIPVSGQLLPKGPVVDQVTLDLAVNAVLRKVIRQAERFKQLDLYDGSAADDMRRINEADDGEAILCARPQQLRPWASTPPNPQLFALMMQFKQLHSQVCGNLETLLGLSRQAGTARQEELLNKNASATIGAMQAVAQAATTKVMDDCLWYWWRDQAGVMDDVYKLETDPENQVVRTVGPRERQGVAWEDLEIQVDPYSFSGDTPEGRRQQLRDLVNATVPILPILGQQGVQLDARYWLKKEGEYANNPDVEDLFQLAEPIDVGAGGGEDTPGMPPNTNRTYTRKSESEATQGGQEQDMIQQMMGAGAVSAGDFGGAQ